MIKVAHLQDGLLLPHPPDLRQKPGSLKQKPVTFPPNRQAPVDGLAQQGWIITCLNRSCRSTSHPVFLQADQPEMRGQSPFSSCETPPLKKRLDFWLCVSALLCGGSCYVPAPCVHFLIPNLSLSSISGPLCSYGLCL